MIVYKYNLFYFIKLKSVWITAVVLLSLTLLSNIILSVMLTQYTDSTVTFFWFSFSLILIQLAVTNIQIFIVIFNQQKRVGIVDLEIQKGVKKHTVILARIAVSFTITLGLYVLNIAFYELIVAPNAAINVSAIGLYTIAILATILFDFVFKGFMMLLIGMKKAALGISLGSILAVIIVANPIISVGFSVPITTLYSNDDWDADAYIDDYNQFVIASEFLSVSNKYQNGIGQSYKEAFSNLAIEKANNSTKQDLASDIGSNLFEGQTILNGDLQDTTSSKNFIKNNLFYLNTSLGLSTDQIIGLVDQNYFSYVVSNSSVDTSKNAKYEVYLDNNTTINDFYSKALNPQDNSADYSSYWKQFIGNKDELSKKQLRSGFNNALKIVEKNIDSTYKQEFIEMEPILTAYFFDNVIAYGNIQYVNSGMNYNFYNEYENSYKQYGIDVDINGISEYLKNVNPFICQIRAIFYNIYSFLYDNPLVYNYRPLLKSFYFDANASVSEKNAFLSSWSKNMENYSKRYYSNPLVIYISFLYNQSPNFLDNVYANTLDTITFSYWSDRFEPYGPINIHLDDNGQIDQFSIEHKLYYINALVWIAPILVGILLTSFGGFIYTRRLLR